LILPIEEYDIYKESDSVWKYTNSIGNQYYIHPELEEDLSEIFGVQKYEPPIPADLCGQVSGNFPSYLRKTDQERIQNIWNKESHEIMGHEFEVTIKLDGTSATYFRTEEKAGVCKRNFELKLEHTGSKYVSLALETGILEHLPVDYAVQCEIYGNNIGGSTKNWDDLETTKLYIFDVWNIKEQKYLTPSQRHTFFDRYLSGKHDMILHVPVLKHLFRIIKDTTLSSLLELADCTPSISNPVSEGLVFKRIDGKYSFKVISNKWLLKNE
jgi:RNA ligase (TIGR02306 family)